MTLVFECVNVARYSNAFTAVTARISAVRHDVLSLLLTGIACILCTAQDLIAYLKDATSS
jgi:hypothetical protein